MAKRKRSKKRRGEAADAKDARAEQPAAEQEIVVFDPQRAKKPLQVATVFSVLILLVGIVMLILGGGVVSGKITDGWGFPMSAVPNWGRPWGLVLMLAGIAYVVCPILLLIRPKNGSLAMMIVSGLSVLLGTPLITTTTEIFYNLFQDTKSRPDWVDSVWAYFIIVHVVILIAIYRAHSPHERQSKVTQAG